MLQLLPVEISWSIYKHLEYGDLKQLLRIDYFRSSAEHFVRRYFCFHQQVTVLLRAFESSGDVERTASEALGLICEQVRPKALFDRKGEFNKYLGILQQLTLERVLSEDLARGYEARYGELCLMIRSVYLQTASIRALHDSKYRRRSTKSPLAPFLPRSFLYVWREHCAQKIGENLKIRTRFAKYFGALFYVTSLYLESCLDGSFDECVREALVSENAQDLLVLCLAAGRPVEVEEMGRKVAMAGEQLRTYLETMAVSMISDPTPQQELRLSQQQDSSLPEWLIPDRYTVHKDTLFRLKVKL